MRKASTRLPEQGAQTPSPAPDLIPAEPKNQPRNHIAIGTANGGTSRRRNGDVTVSTDRPLSLPLPTIVLGSTDSFEKGPILRQLWVVHCAVGWHDMQDRCAGFRFQTNQKTVSTRQMC
jgi:hypothetical protein